MKKLEIEPRIHEKSCPKKVYNISYSNKRL